MSRYSFEISDHLARVLFGKKLINQAFEYPDYEFPVDWQGIPAHIKAGWVNTAASHVEVILDDDRNPEVTPNTQMVRFTEKITMIYRENAVRTWGQVVVDGWFDENRQHYISTINGLPVKVVALKKSDNVSSDRVFIFHQI